MQFQVVVNEGCLSEFTHSPSRGTLCAGSDILLLPRMKVLASLKACCLALMVLAGVTSGLIGPGALSNPMANRGYGSIPRDCDRFASSDVGVTAVMPYLSGMPAPVFLTPASLSTESVVVLAGVSLVLTNDDGSLWVGNGGAVERKRAVFEPSKKEGAVIYNAAFTFLRPGVTHLWIEGDDGNRIVFPVRVKCGPVS